MRTRLRLEQDAQTRVELQESIRGEEAKLQRLQELQELADHAEPTLQASVSSMDTICAQVLDVGAHGTTAETALLSNQLEAQTRSVQDTTQTLQKEYENLV